MSPSLRALLALAGLSGTFTLASCGGGGTEPTSHVRLPTAVAVVAGDGQRGAVGQPLSAPVVIRVVDAGGIAVSGQEVSFVVTAGGGSADPATATTDGNGRAQTNWTLGPSSGQAQTLEARVSAANGQPLLSASFEASATPGPIDALVKVSGDEQLADTGSALASPVVVRATDRFGNAAAGETVTWSASSGGTVSTASSTVDSDGTAKAGWTLGPAGGAQALTASGGGKTTSFTATATVHPQWTRMNSPASATLHDVWGTSASNVWAVGDGGTILHFDGTQWSAQSSGTTQPLRRVWGTSPTNVYAISAGDGVLLHFDGGSWGPVAPPPRLAARKFVWWVNSPTDAVAAVNDGTGILDSIMHWDGAAWTTQVRDVRDVSALWMAPDGRALVGQRTPGDPGLYYDGGSWRAGGGGSRVVEFQGKSFADVFVMQNAAVGGCCQIQHFNGSAIDFTGPVKFGYDFGWFGSPREVFLISYVADQSAPEGEVMRITPASGSLGRGEGVWGRAMWGASPADLFVVGAGGSIYRGTR